MQEMGKFKYFLRKHRLAIAGYLFITPSVLFFIAIYAYPVLYALVMSFFDWKLLAGSRPFIGFQNFKYVFSSASIFWPSLKVTAYYSVTTVFLFISLGLILAVVFNKLIPSIRTLMRTITFLPVLTSGVAIAIIWKWMYVPRGGLLNGLFAYIGLGPFKFLTSSKQVMPSIIASSVWSIVGYDMLIFTAGLASIPNEYYEAAKIDGASEWDLFWHITLPLLRPVTFFLVVTGLIGAFQAFTPMYVMANGGPGISSTTLTLYIYREAFQRYKMGLGCAIAFVQFLMILFLTVVQFKSYLRREG